jgi:hypothetical protein
VIAAHEGEVYALASLDDGTLASGGEDAMVRIHGSAVPVGGFARSICRVPGRDAIAVASYDGSIRIIETAK